MKAKSKDKTIFVCSECGAKYHKWVGKCSECGAWNSVVEEVIPSAKSLSVSKSVTPPLKIDHLEPPRSIKVSTGIEEIDRVIGGGFLKGSVTLISGNPGIGKSTIALQIANSIHNKKVFYFSAEESPEQLKIRAERLKLSTSSLYVSEELLLENIVHIVENQSPEIVIIDSIQTIYSGQFDSLPGGVLQVRECALKLLNITKARGLITLLIGHITKEGAIAGPKVLEHLVDTVLLLEGDQNNFFRILRCLKNRFGTTKEIGIFEMREDGLHPVKDPSYLFISKKKKHASGSSITVSMEGIRPLLVEIQALTAKSIYSTPQRNSNGIDYRRLTMLLAVLEKRAGISLSTFDIFVNVVGGLKLHDPATDLAVISAILSSYHNRPLPSETAFIGEVGLVGEIRPVRYIDTRINEAVKLGFRKVYVPSISELKTIRSEIRIIKVESVNQLIEKLSQQ
ncbi:MAG: DNA repair protein RadA [Candidatus Marinimicrobia bacterium]|nr:DNA repair protein RadA [Candidatus Neomarinimicrobiota bacterium]